ncbi:DUF1811 family protein [Desmospora activa]|uniref:Uncharacterized protein DUF1811 n=1 Tax=Desmospora activa DSM 45169 TaxID=1121389 RepID=A0A2T4Z3Q7_9BACL|nr:DUF1811 family protein [Desmospora activa]PTM56528.1 uncharacterized protein DUF1811 [Desmospora activa DSM 45169]
MRHFSRMSTEEVKREIQRLEQAKVQAQRSSQVGELAVIQRQIQFALSYLRDPAEISPGHWYRVEGEEALFQVDYLNGVMAWGTYEGSSIQEAVPIGILHPMPPS